ncbi:MAG: Mutual gliding-motility protein MglA [Candidatus Heimdallarchaeota archaeon LC_3]|jgi:small GTP-binding protein|nr:MAG: Mutual gliding-motility protein MglA [Candidatus Heimdallarchaeota archaeon LC_3]
MSADSVTVGETAAGIKIVFFGPSLAGKTTTLSIFHAIRKREDPSSVYQFLKLEDKATQRTIGFDHAIFGLGDKGTSGQHDFKIHLFTVPGQDRFKAMRKVVAQGLQGLIVVIDSSKAQWEANKISLSELFQIMGEQITSGQVAVQIMLNKMDLPQEQRISSFEAAQLLVDAGIKKNIGDAQVSILDVSCLQAVKDLAEVIKAGKFDPKDRPPSIQRIIQPIQMIIREILIKELRKRQTA